MEESDNTLLLASAGVFGLIALVAIHQRLLLAAVCALATIGFAAFGFLRHWEARAIEYDLAHLSAFDKYSTIVTNRIHELTDRYNSLLATGDARIEYYYEQIYTKAEAQRHEAMQFRRQAQIDREAVDSVDQRIFSMAERLLDDHRKWVSKKLRADPENYNRNKSQLTKAFDFVVSIGYKLPRSLRSDTLKKLKTDYAAKVREQVLKDEQRLIKQQMREEAKIRKEREEAIREADDREQELQRLLDQAMRKHQNGHDAEILELQQQLAEAHASSERAISMAQQTKAGNVYILSNIGSFGENIFKVGMTRRVDPDLRVKELGDASVPFPFDVHAMIGCDDAPKLESTLHRELTRFRVNRVNLRKEYFAVELATILDAVRSHHGRIEYVAEPEALQYRESLEITPEQLLENHKELVELGVDFEEWSE